MVERLKSYNEKLFPKSFENRLDFLFERINPFDKTSFDLDGVIINSAVPVVGKFNELFGTNYLPSKIDNWNSLKDWVVKKGIPEEEAKELSFNLWTDPYLLSLAEPVPGSIEFYRKLAKFSKREIPFITVRNCGLREVTFSWMKKYLPEVPERLINMRDDKEIGANDFKIGKLKKLNIDWHFEDSLEVMNLIISNLKKTKVVYISYAPTEIPLDIITKKRSIVVPSWEWFSDS
ncbi:hypothetical protein KJ570_03850 [Patescibacteria group bacterium]|nr:hypothetical protein [Patescibacteria group bacterium]MBU2036365.1 hypothetical protein [Patescibacteria group bacterium]